MKQIHYILSSLLVFIFFTSCENYKDCNSPVDTFLGIGFYHLENGKLSEYTLPSPTLHAVNKPDTVFLYHNNQVTGVFLPLNPHTTLTEFYIQPDSTLTGGDTISITYTATLQFVSSGCGFTNYYKLDTVTATRHYIDSIVLSKRDINTTNATNVQIYY